MKTITATFTVIFLAALASVFYVGSKDSVLTPVPAGIPHVLRPKPAPPAESARQKDVAALISDAERIEKDLADLQHEIDRGEFVRLINDPQTSPDVKAELRGRIRLFAQLAVKLTRLQIEQLEQGSL